MSARWDRWSRWLMPRPSPHTGAHRRDGQPLESFSTTPFDFDRLAQELAEGMPRREALRRLGQGLAGAFLTSLGLASAAQAVTCPPGLKLCYGRCVNRQTDPNHCGGCGRACPAQQVCVDGKCVPCPPTASFCGGTQGLACCDSTKPTCCDGVCCAAGQYCCSSGCSVCPCDQSYCTGSQGTHCCVAGETCCDGACVNTQTDPLNCGECSRACSADATCSSGRCVCDYPRIPCGAACCDASEICLSGACATCPTNQVPCGDRCCPELAICRGINYEIGVGQCGCPRTSAIISCGAACCDAQEQVCLDGSCTTCPGSQRPCGDRCCPETTLCTRSDGYGRCFCDVGYTPCGTDPLSCCNDATQVCRDGICVGLVGMAA